MKPGVLAIAGVFLATLLVHAAAKDGKFVFFDDDRFVTRNPNIDRVDVGRFFGDPSSTAAPDNPTRDIYRPIRTLSFALINSVSGKEDAEPFHALAVFVHALTAAVLFAVVRAAGFDPWPAAAGALFWALHPASVEVTAWVCSLGDAWCGLFSALSVLFWAKDRRVAAMAMLVLAMFSKEHAVVVPGIWVAWDFFYRRERIRQTLLRGALPGALLIAAFLVYRGSLGLSMAQVEQRPGPDLLLSSLGWYAVTILWPFGPTFQATVVPSTEGIAAGLAVIAALVYGFVRGSRTTRLALAWFLLALIPVSHLIAPLKIPTADRFLYLPLMGLALLPAQLCMRLRPQATWASAFVLLGLALLTRVRIDDWKDSESLIAAGLRVEPKSHMLLWAEASHLAQAAVIAMDQRKFAEAEPLVNQAVAQYQLYIRNARDRELVRPYYEMGVLLQEWGTWMQRRDKRQPYVNAFSRALEAYATAHKLVLAGNPTSPVHDEAIADRGSQVAAALSEQSNPELSRTVQVGLDMCRYLQDKFHRDMDMRRAQFILAHAITLRVRDAGKATEAYNAILEVMEQQEQRGLYVKWMRAQAYYWRGSTRPFDRPDLERAHKLFMAVIRERPRDLSVNATFWAARSCCTIAKIFNDPAMVERGKLILKSIPKVAKDNRLKIPEMLRRQMLGEARTCIAGEKR